MAVYAITGKLGGGKGKAAVMKAREYLRRGRRIAGNIDLFMEHLGDERDRGSYTRIPDKPSATDLYMLGSGNPFVQFKPDIRREKDGLKGYAPADMQLLPGFDEAHNGALFLDECGSWLNTRNYAEKGRGDLLEWMIHARKYGWDVYFVMQNINQADKQLREAMFEYVVRLTRMDRMRVPVVSDLVKGVTAGTLSGNLPRLHIAVVRLGSNPDGLVADRWVFRGDDLQPAYNTTQVFSEHYQNGTHCLLSSWHLSGKLAFPPDFVGPVPDGGYLRMAKPRAQPLAPPHPHMTKFLFAALLLGAGLGSLGNYMYRPKPVEPVAGIVNNPSKVVGSSSTVLGMGYSRQGNKVMVFVSDGRALVPNSFRVDDQGNWEAELPDGVHVKGVAP
jgi:hypothetical protein